MRYPNDLTDSFQTAVPLPLAEMFHTQMTNSSVWVRLLRMQKLKGLKNFHIYRLLVRSYMWLLCLGLILCITCLYCVNLCRTQVKNVMKLHNQCCCISVRLVTFRCDTRGDTECRLRCKEPVRSLTTSGVCLRIPTVRGPPRGRSQDTSL